MAFRQGSASGLLSTMCWAPPGGWEQGESPPAPPQPVELTPSGPNMYCFRIERLEWIGDLDRNFSASPSLSGPKFAEWWSAFPYGKVNLLYDQGQFAAAKNV